MKKDIYHIASEYFSGRISESDLHFLQSWLLQSEDNKRLLGELEQIWKMTGGLGLSLTPDVEAEWGLFVKERSKATDNKIFSLDKKIKIINYLKIAAVVVPSILVISFGLFYLTGKPTQLATINTANDKKEIILSDGSKVWINKNSSFTYPVKFSKNERVVELKGEAFFEVTKRGKPFKIVVGKTQVIVVGTAFNIRAYQQEKTTEVIVNKGIVILESRMLGKKAVLKAGDKGTCDEPSGEITKGKVADFNAFGWKDEHLSFVDTPVGDIEIILSRYFNIHVKVDPTMKECKFTGEFKEPQLNEILKVITISLGATYQLKNDTIFVSGKGCKN